MLVWVLLLLPLIPLISSIPGTPLISHLLPSVLLLTEVFGWLEFLDSSDAHAASFWCLCRSTGLECPPLDPRLYIAKYQYQHASIPNPLQLPGRCGYTGIPNSLQLWQVSDCLELMKINRKAIGRFVLRIPPGIISCILMCGRTLQLICVYLPFSLLRSYKELKLQESSIV